MASGPLGAEPHHLPDTEQDVLARRCAAAEAEVERLRAELDETRAQLAAQQEESEVSGDRLSLFEGPAQSDGLVGDGSDPRVLSLILGATAVVAAMVTLLAFLNDKLTTPFGFIMVALTIALAWGAAKRRVQPIEVHFARGIVYAERGETSYRFDLRRPETQVEMVGRPGDSDWAVRFPRRHLEPFVIDASMVEAEEFVEKLREFRPDL